MQTHWGFFLASAICAAIALMAFARHGKIVKRRQAGMPVPDNFPLHPEDGLARYFGIFILAAAALAAIGMMHHVGYTYPHAQW